MAARLAAEAPPRRARSARLFAQRSPRQVLLLRARSRQIRTSRAQARQAPAQRPAWEPQPARSQAQAQARSAQARSARLPARTGRAARAAPQDRSRQPIRVAVRGRVREQCRAVVRKTPRACLAGPGRPDRLRGLHSPRTARQPHQLPRMCGERRKSPPTPLPVQPRAWTDRSRARHRWQAAQPMAVRPAGQASCDEEIRTSEGEGAGRRAVGAQGTARADREAVGDDTQRLNLRQFYQRDAMPLSRRSSRLSFDPVRAARRAWLPAAAALCATLAVAQVPAPGPGPPRLSRRCPRRQRPTMGPLSRQPRSAPWPMA